jgi:hypothetical protein
MQQATIHLCGARTRSGAQCRSPVVKGRSRCRMHGGKSPGAPKGNKNAWKHGRYSRVAIAERSEVRRAVQELQRLIRLAPTSKGDAQ